jgi:hypothetical protein
MIFSHLNVIYFDEHHLCTWLLPEEWPRHALVRLYRGLGLLHSKQWKSLAFKYLPHDKLSYSLLHTATDGRNEYHT